MPSRFFAPNILVQTVTWTLTITVGIVLHQYAQTITAWLAQDMLPLAMLPHSKGSYYPGFNHDGGFAHQLELLGILIALTPLIWLSIKVFARSGLAEKYRTISISVPEIVPTLLLASAGFALYSYLAYPPYTFPSNARIHWVDIYFTWQDKWVYALPKLINPLFHGFPHILVGIYGGLSVALFYSCLRHLKFRQSSAFIGAVAYLSASNLLIFANMAEDINLSIVTLLFATYCFLSKRWVLFGVATFLTFLARPTNVLAPIILGLAYYFSLYEFSLLRFLQSPIDGFRRESGLLTAAIVALLPAIAWNAYLIAIGQHYLFGIEKTAIDNLSTQRSIPVDGFTIERFSGTVLLHQLWVFPIPITVFALATIRYITKNSDPNRTFYMGALAIIAANILLVEYLKMWYFNIRYLTYFYPLLLLIAFGATQQLFTSTPARYTALAFLALSTSTTVNYAFDAREKLLHDSFIMAYEEQDNLRSAIEHCNRIWTDYPSRSKRNALAYLLKSNVLTFKILTGNVNNQLSQGDCLVSEKSRNSLNTLYKGQYLSVFRR